MQFIDCVYLQMLQFANKCQYHNFHLVLMDLYYEQVLDSGLGVVGRLFRALPLQQHHSQPHLEVGHPSQCHTHQIHSK